MESQNPSRGNQKRFNQTARRSSENIERTESLADCERAEEAFRVHSKFFQTAAQQYLEQTSTVLSTMSKMTEEFWGPLRTHKEETSRSPRPKTD